MKTITCKCGRQLECFAFTNTCECGRDYNHAGQCLAPRSQWGEETGETAAEILAATSHHVTERRVVHTLWPSRGTMYADDVVRMAHDAWRDEAPRHRCLVCGVVTVGFAHGKPLAEVQPGEFLCTDPNHPCHRDHPSAGYDPITDAPEPGTDLEACCAYLEDRGLVTFSRGADIAWTRPYVHGEDDECPECARDDDEDGDEYED